MTPLARLLASCACFILALAVVSASATSIGDASEITEKLCWQGTVGSSTAHDFAGNGACYKCEPNTCHGVTLEGYCHEYHYTSPTGCGQQ